MREEKTGVVENMLNICPAKKDLFDIFFVGGDCFQLDPLNHVIIAGSVDS